MLSFGTFAFLLSFALLKLLPYSALDPLLCLAARFSDRLNTIIGDLIKLCFGVILGRLIPVCIEADVIVDPLRRWTGIGR